MGLIAIAILFILVVDFFSDSGSQKPSHPSASEASPKAFRKRQTVDLTIRREDRATLESERPQKYITADTNAPNACSNDSREQPRNIVDDELSSLNLERDFSSIQTFRENTRQECKPEVKKYLLDNNLSRLYHFTDRSNVDSIIKHGALYSWAFCESNGITIPRPGGNQLSRDLDRRRGLENFVRLSFTKEHPMLYHAKNDGRINDVVILEIDARVLLWNTTLVSDQNANANSASIGSTLEDLRRVKLDIMNPHGFPDDETRKYLQAEALVEEFVPGYLIYLDGKPLREPTDAESRLHRSPAKISSSTLDS